MGLSLLLYPTISDLWNKKHQTQVIAVFEKQIQEIDSKQAEALLAQAKEYNKKLDEASDRLEFLAGHYDEYKNTLNIDDSGVMGYIDIPQIGVKVPIYHGTSEDVLQVAIGHVDWSSIPVGGKGTHAVLSGHRGLPSAKLFTDLDRIKQGDVFEIHVANEVLHYEVDKISEVRPSDTSLLLPEEDKDYCTLVTCTPYGINTHRLLVRGKRISPAKLDMGDVVSEAYTVSSYLIILISVVIVSILYSLVLFIRKKKIKSNKV
ncbi:Sortase A, LPXTG specific [Lachnospiraceae bacterium TWA4]|nr:Sortase A, LPXTG specific [Lachnospiraceae bacterium TWA4]